MVTHTQLEGISFKKFDNFIHFYEKPDFSAFFLLFMASIRLRSLDQPLVPGVFFIETFPNCLIVHASLKILFRHAQLWPDQLLVVKTCPLLRFHRIDSSKANKT